MTALNASRRQTERAADLLNVPVKAASQIFQGGLVVLVAGVAVAGRVAATRAELATMAVVGIATADALGGAADGSVKLDVKRTVAKFANSAAGDAITLADRNSMAFLVDDQTVAKTVGAGLRPLAGRIIDVDADGVWVEVGEAPGRRREFLTLSADDLRGAQATVYRITAPRAGAITNILSRLGGALLTGDATITGKIGATNITGGLLTLIQAGSAAGDATSAAPTAANAVAEGDQISFTVGGANTAQVPARLVIEITY